jgi:hypothetical protein
MAVDDHRPSGCHKEAFVDACIVGKLHFVLDQSELVRVFEHRFDRVSVNLEVEWRYLLLSTSLSARRESFSLERPRRARISGLGDVSCRPLHGVAHRPQASRRDVAIALAPIEVEGDHCKCVVRNVVAGSAEIGESGFLRNIVIRNQLQSGVDRTLLEMLQALRMRADDRESLSPCNIVDAGIAEDRLFRALLVDIAALLAEHNAKLPFVDLSFRYGRFANDPAGLRMLRAP